MANKQLWQKGAELDETLHRFTVGNDPVNDLNLLPWDILGTAAHVRMLKSCGLLPDPVATALCRELALLQQSAREGRIEISPEQEDCHTLIEHALSQALGEDGRRVHLGRSRNDQVLTALRLFMRSELFDLADGLLKLTAALLACANEWGNRLLPGYTHMRRAMPSSFGLWAAAYAAGLLEEAQALRAVYQRIDACPLGSGAGFGIPLPLDRSLSATLLGFSAVQLSSIDAANSRGRMELALAGWLAGLALLLEKLLWDLALFSTEEFGFFALPEAFTTGSSIMPQKRNPDVIELARGRCAQLRAWRGELEQLSCGLPGSYHRDFQLQKEPLLRSVHGGRELLQVLLRLLPGLAPLPDRAAAACTPEIYAAQEAYQRVASSGLAFRDAYLAVARDLERGNGPEAVAQANSSGDNLDQQLVHFNAALAGQRTWLQAERGRVNACLSRLL